VKYDNDDLNRYTVADLFSDFGFKHHRERGPCPLCKTSKDSQSFSFKGNLFLCFACGAKGNTAQLYAKVAGVSIGNAIEQIATRLGLTAADPAEWDKRKAERDAAAAAERESAQAESWRLTRLARRGFESERQAESLHRLAFRIQSPDALGLAYDAEGEAMMADYLLGQQ